MRNSSPSPSPAHHVQGEGGAISVVSGGCRRHPTGLPSFSWPAARPGGCQRLAARHQQRCTAGRAAIRPIMLSFNNPDPPHTPLAISHREVICAPLDDAAIKLVVLHRVAILLGKCRRGRRVCIHFVDGIQGLLHLQVVLLRVCGAVRVDDKRVLVPVHWGGAIGRCGGGVGWAGLRLASGCPWLPRPLPPFRAPPRWLSVRVPTRNTCTSRRGPPAHLRTE